MGIFFGYNDYNYIDDCMVNLRFSPSGEELTRREVIRAIEVYAGNGIEFQEANPLDADSTDIIFMFMNDNRHADGKVFHGAGVEKAHAFVPVNGEIHFNNFETFSVKKQDAKKTSLFYVALHEIGHALGLKHSSLHDAVMNEKLVLFEY